jgi:hypothetical protein
MGEAANAVKKLKGARLGVPVSFHVEIHPMGRGTTRDVRSW